MVSDTSGHSAQARADQKRRPHHYQVRLDPQLSFKLRDYMARNNLSANQALKTIVHSYFN
jgi:D-hexose-6-phosphate mutarotase